MNLEKRATEKLGAFPDENLLKSHPDPLLRIPSLVGFIFWEGLLVC